MSPSASRCRALCLPLTIASICRLFDCCSRVRLGSPADTVDTSSPCSPSPSTSTCVSSSESTRPRSRSSGPSRQSSQSLDSSSKPFTNCPSVAPVVSTLHSKTGTVYICNGCESHHIQAFGKIVESPQNRGPGMNYLYKNHSGPPVGARCEQCGSAHHVRAASVTQLAIALVLSTVLTKSCPPIFARSARRPFVDGTDSRPGVCRQGAQARRQERGQVWNRAENEGHAHHGTRCK